MQVELTERERELLLDVLEDRLGSLKEQVRHSRTTAFRDMLKETERLLQGLIEKLRAGEPAASAPR